MNDDNDALIQYSNFPRVQSRTVFQYAKRPEITAPEPAETSMPIGEMEIPEEIEIPAFLATDPPESVPEALLDLVRENEPYGDTRERLWSVFVSIQHKLADDGKTMPKATSEEVLLYTRLYPHMGWMAKPGAVEVI